MRGETYIVIGSGQAESRGVGSKGTLLDKAARAGIRVPKGVILLDVAWDHAMLAGLMTIEGEQVRIPDAARFLSFFQIPPLYGPLAVRSAFSTEDANGESLAGYFKTVLHVAADDPRALADAIVAVLGSAAGRGGEMRRDVIIMPMVKAEIAGVAFTEREFDDDLVNYTEGLADDLLAGTESGHSLSLAKLHSYEKRIRGESLEPWMRRLQNLLREVRRWLGSRDWDIEWADDGEQCYLLQLRPVTAPTRRNEAFTIANHREVLPDLPSILMTSVVESCANDLYNYYRQFDPSLPKKRPFTEVFYGRPYLNLDLLTETMRIWGLPTDLLTNSIGGEAGRVYGWNFSRALRKTLRLILPRLLWAQLQAPRAAANHAQKIGPVVEQAGQSFNEQLDLLRWLYVILVREMFSLMAASGPVTLLLRKLGTLHEHAARQTSITTRINHDLEPLRQYVAGNAHLIPQLERGEMPDDATFQALFAEYLQAYGHRGIYESDIARPRYHEQPAPLLSSLTQPPGKRLPPTRRSLRSFLTAPLWWQAGRAIRAREQWRHIVMAGFDRVRQNLLKLAEPLVEAGTLPDLEALWLLTVDEARQLDKGWQPDAAFFRQRKEQIERLKTYRLPDLVHRFDDLERYRDGADVTAEQDYVSGISLTTGIIEGRAWMLHEPRTMLPDDFGPDDTILVARAVDAGWIPTFMRVAGVIVETGGDLSHGSIILRELGVPAITNARQATCVFATGDRVYLDAGRGQARVLDIDGGRDHME